MKTKPEPDGEKKKRGLHTTACCLSESHRQAMFQGIESIEQGGRHNAGTGASAARQIVDQSPQCQDEERNNEHTEP